MKYPIKSNAGFTLLEVLIAIAILSILMVSIYGIIDNSTESKDKITTEDRDKLSIETALTRLETDIEFLYSPLYFEATKKEDDQLFAKVFQKEASAEEEIEESVYDEKINRYESLEHYAGVSEYNRPIPKVITEGTGNLIFFSATNRRLIKNSKQSRFQWVKYSVVTDPDSENKEAPLMLTRATINENIYSSTLEWDKQKAHKVLGNLKEFKFSYYDKKRDKFFDSLDELSTNKLSPRLVKVSLSYASMNGENYEGQRVFRPNWPFTDTRKAIEEKYKFKNTGPTGGLSNGEASGDFLNGDND